jgi:DNA-binding MarR family transcriptional regulator
LYDTTDSSTPGPFPDDHLRRLLHQLAQTGGLLEVHDHGGIRLSVSEVFALGELSDAGTLSQRDLAVRLGLEKSTVSRLAAGMQQRGWLARERDPDNRRLYRLRLTAKGRAAAHRVGADLHDRHAELFAALTPEERAGLALGLSGLLRAIGHLHSGAHVRPGEHTHGPGGSHRHAHAPPGHRAG